MNNAQSFLLRGRDTEHGHYYVYVWSRPMFTNKVEKSALALREVAVCRHARCQGLTRLGGIKERAESAGRSSSINIASSVDMEQTLV